MVLVLFQKRFTRMIDEVCLLPYSERLGFLKLTTLILYTRYPIVARRAWPTECVARAKLSCIQTLIERRTRGDLIEVFKSKKKL